MAKGKRDHYIPAALIGGFGEPAKQGGPREARVAVWQDNTSRVDIMKAKNVGWERNLYGIPTVSRSAAAFEEVWQMYEGRLPAAIKHLETENPSAEDLGALLAHAAFAVPRSPAFTKALRKWSAKQGIAITEAEARNERAEWLAGGLQVETWQWRALHAPDFSEFVLPDTGFAKIQPDEDNPLYYVHLPLSPRIALFLKRQESGDPPGGPERMDYRQLTCTAGDVVNDASAKVADRTVLIGHPSRAEKLAEIATAPRIPRTLRGGPYVGKNSDWF